MKYGNLNYEKLFQQAFDQKYQDGHQACATINFDSQKFQLKT